MLTIAHQLIVAVIVAFLLSPVTVFAGQMEHHHDAHSMQAHSAHTGAAAHIHHPHPKGAWMLEYRYMRMAMGRLLNGSDSVASQTISGALPGIPPLPDPTKAYRMAPTRMTMDMHMLMAMYGLTNRVTLMGMTQYRDNDMDMVMHMPAMDMFGTMETGGLGDSMIGVMINTGERVTGSLGLGIPTGDIDKYANVTMSGSNPMTGMTTSVPGRVKAGYPMQLGSGTWDLTPSLTYVVAGKRIGAGIQGSYTWRMGNNKNHYSLGNTVEFTTWAKHAINKYLLGSIKLTYTHRGRIDGEDANIDSTLSPTNDPRTTGGSRLDLSIGLNGFFSNGHAVGIELGLPVLQHLNGPQMEADWMLSLVYQHM